MSEASPTNDELAAEIADIVERLAASLPKEIAAGSMTLKSKIPFKVLSIRELLIHRVHELGKTALECLAAGQVVAGAALARAVIETVAVTFVLYERLERFLASTNEAEFDEFLLKTLMGSRIDQDLVVANNVLTLIDRLHKAVDGTRTTYDALCEITHPNWAGLLGAFGTLDRSTYVLALGPSTRTRGKDVALSALSGALLTFEHYYNEMAPMIYRLNDHYESKTS